MIIDTHIHICDERYDSDREEVLKRAEKEGVKKFINIGAEEKENEKVANFEREGVYKSFGIHPHYALEINNEKINKIKNYVKECKNVVAIGEIGLDFFKNQVPKEKQIDIFERFLQIAKDFNLPVIIHSREAHKEVFQILKSFALEKKGIIHCFTGDYEIAKKFLDLGFLLGIGGIVTFPKADLLKETVKKLGLNSFVLETDAPYLAPQQVRGKRNESAYLKFIIEDFATIKNVTKEEIIKKTTDNVFKIFNLN